MLAKTDEEVLEALEEEFPEEQLKTIETGSGRNRKKFSYIPEPVVRNRLREVLGLNWSWEILREADTTFLVWDRDAGEKLPQPAVVVTGRLTVNLPSGITVSREAHGGSLLYSGNKAGDPHKSASSNALKKAAYLFGVGAYLGLNSEEAIDDTTSWGTSNSSSNTSSNWTAPAATGGGNVQDPWAS
jgi:hypothetical protein